MSREIAFSAINIAMEKDKSSGLLFYGGEPLLEKQLIYDIVDYTENIKKKTGHNFFYKITTNGTLLDEEFIKFARDVNMPVNFSHDGISQDECRLFYNGSGSFEMLNEKIRLLLEYHPYAVAMIVADPSTVYKAAENVEFLYDKGFKYITFNLNYSKNAPWTRKLLSVLEGEYKKMAKMYIQRMSDEQKIYLSPFDMKIISHLKGEKYSADRRLVNREQPSVAPDGRIYSISKHINDPEFSIGDVFSGIDSVKRELLDKKGGELLNPCRECAIRTRCNYAYDNLSRCGKEIFTEVSPVQCMHEKMLTPIADHVAETLYNKRSPLFIHKHYNKQYPLISLLEDFKPG